MSASDTIPAKCRLCTMHSLVTVLTTEPPTLLDLRARPLDGGWCVCVARGEQRLGEWFVSLDAATFLGLLNDLHLAAGVLTEQN